jgi:uncharacterized protein (TIGR02186 family)
MVFMALTLVWAPFAKADTLIADLSSHLIAITTGFKGTDLLMFGSIDAPGDIVVVVQGPLTSIIVRKKERVAGVWVNQANITFENIPSFYALASSKPIEQILSPETQKQLNIGIENVPMKVDGELTPEEEKQFHEALITNKRLQELYYTDIARVNFMGRELFRTNIFFPSNVPTGDYIVDIMLVRDKNVVGVQRTPLVVSKVGFGAEIFDFAHQQKWFYGSLSIGLAILGGGVGYVFFRRR